MPRTHIGVFLLGSSGDQVSCGTNLINCDCNMPSLYVHVIKDAESSKYYGRLIAPVSHFPVECLWICALYNRDI